MHVIVVVLQLVSASPFSAEGEGEKIAGSDAQLWPTSSCAYASADYVSLFSACALVLVRLLLTLRCCPRVLVLPRCVLYVRLVCCCGCVHLHEVEACGNNKLCCLAVLFCTEWSHGSVVVKTTTQHHPPSSQTENGDCIASVASITPLLPLGRLQRATFHGPQCCHPFCFHDPPSRCVSSSHHPYESL